MAAMLLTVRQAAALLKATERQVYRWVDEDEIPFQRVRDQVRFNRTELLEWATRRRLPVALEAFDSDDPDDPAPSLAAALRLGGVRGDLGAKDREQALRAVVDAVPLPPGVDRELVTEMLIVRETTSSTAIGDGIAIPHVRHPVVAAGAPATVTVCYLAEPIAFGAPDQQAVHTIIMIVSPTVRKHLQMLAHLARALSHAEFRSVILRRGGLEELMREATRLEAGAAAKAGSSSPA